MACPCPGLDLHSLSNIKQDRTDVTHSLSYTADIFSCTTVSLPATYFWYRRMETATASPCGSICSGCCRSLAHCSVKSRLFRRQASGSYGRRAARSASSCASHSAHLQSKPHCGPTHQDRAKHPASSSCDAPDMTLSMSRQFACMTMHHLQCLLHVQRAMLAHLWVTHLGR